MITNSKENDVKWFSKDDIKKLTPITVYNLHGIVLPHAGTSYSGDIISHTLRYRPKKKFENIVIFYLPASDAPDVKDEYHEYVVPSRCLKLFYPDKNYIGYNMLSNENPSIQEFNLQNTLFIISADFSHFLQFDEAIEKENCAAKSLMFRNYKTVCSDVVDHKKTFKFFFNKFPKLVLDWVGRTRSPGEKGVGYLSFLIRSKINFKRKIPDGFFVTAYDTKMRGRECLGEFDTWNKEIEQEKVNEVLAKARTSSRLTSGKHLDTPVKYYQITYLFKQETKDFIRGWHSIKGEAFYLSDVFLENTFEDGQWIKNQVEWRQNDNNFDLTETFNMLHSKKLGVSAKNSKANINTVKKYTLYTSEKVFKRDKDISKKTKKRERKNKKKSLKLN